LVPSGTGVELHGHLQVAEYPHIAVDRSHGPSRGTIYVVYPDGRNKIAADNNSASGTVCVSGYFRGQVHKFRPIIFTSWWSQPHSKGFPRHWT